jgi:hypothetical protein
MLQLESFGSGVNIVTVHPNAETLETVLDYKFDPNQRVVRSSDQGHGRVFPVSRPGGQESPAISEYTLSH